MLPMGTRMLAKKNGFIDIRPHSYFHSAFMLDRTLDMFEKVMKHSGVEFDTIVGTGLSGTLVVPFLAYFTNKHFLIIRKQDDRSTHSSTPGEGALGSRWLFVDDLIASGQTQKRVKEVVNSISAAGEFETEYVGMYLYNWLQFSNEQMRIKCYYDEDSKTIKTA